ncbi:MAG TPA: SLATT domain-containing protein [Thermoanaerobaculia bacterium]|nr:SLATT domain-containing protein [Thermoanaerobaculia bacterium]
MDNGHAREELLSRWTRGVKVAMVGHYNAATSCAHSHYLLGFPLVMLSTIAGTSIFAAIGQDPGPLSKAVVGTISILAAVLASAQTFFGYTARAEKHSRAGARFGSLLKEIEQKTAFPPSSDEDLEEWVEDFRKRWTALSDESPTVPRRIWDEANRNVDKELRESRKKPTDLSPDDEVRPAA